tara:strand:- start:2437 stop:2712 length:276 start_codon:yes stop_codon:yes gene_type:complete
MKDNFDVHKWNKTRYSEQLKVANTNITLNEQEDWQGKEWKNRKLLIEVVEGLQRELEEIEDVKLWDDQTSNDWCYDAIEQFTSAAQTIMGE